MGPSEPPHSVDLGAWILIRHAPSLGLEIAIFDRESEHQGNKRAHQGASAWAQPCAGGSFVIGFVNCQACVFFLA